VDALEESNVRMVNSIGVDLNLAVNHDHMHILFSFICALGPRKAKRFIQNVKRYGRPVCMRSDIFNERLLTRDVSFQSHPFFKIRVAAADLNERQIHLLD
jgi:transcriptional accessory protein Tex/SPT6